jgi:hypothetical protein
MYDVLIFRIEEWSRGGEIYVSGVLKSFFEVYM